MTTKLRLLRTENAVIEATTMAVTPMLNSASSRVNPPVLPARRLVDVVLKSIAADVSGELAAAVQISCLPVELKRDLLHVVAVGGADRRRGENHLARINQPLGLRVFGLLA